MSKKESIMEINADDCSIEKTIVVSKEYWSSIQQPVELGAEVKYTQCAVCSRIAYSAADYCEHLMLARPSSKITAEDLHKLTSPADGVYRTDNCGWSSVENKGHDWVDEFEKLTGSNDFTIEFFIPKGMDPLEIGSTFSYGQTAQVVKKEKSYYKDWLGAAQMTGNLPDKVYILTKYSGEGAWLQPHDALYMPKGRSYYLSEEEALAGAGDINDRGDLKEGSLILSEIKDPQKHEAIVPKRLTPILRISAEGMEKL
jgi:hypothetical protein